MKNKCFISLVMLFYLMTPAYGNETNTISKYPDYAKEFLGQDKFENFNRKMFILNGALNKYAVRPITKVWTSIMPKYGMERMKFAYNNILYPRRLVSCIIQKDFKGAGQTTARFLVNSTAGLGGMFDPAKRYLKIEPVNENMEQALAKLKMKAGPYLVLPILSSATPRALFGRALDSALDPTSYVGTPVIAAVKAAFTLNNAALIQPLAKTVETTFLDPYYITKAMYGLQTAILNANYDRRKVLNNADLNAKNKIDPYNNLAETYFKKDIKTIEDEIKEVAAIIETNSIIETETAAEKNLQQENNSTINVSDDSEKETLSEAIPAESTVADNSNSTHPIEITAKEIIKGGTQTDEILYDDELLPDIILKDYNPQHPVIDSMRTALFEMEGIYDSIWDEASIWNRSFNNRVKTSSVQIFDDRDKYKFRYIMQKDKNSPLAIIYPSVGEGIESHHSTQLAKLFYDEGYSVAILGSAFHFSFVKSMPENYHPGIPTEDVKYIKKATSTILDTLEKKYECKFKDKVVLGTSFGAMSSLFLAESEAKENTLNISKFISICPPVELMYAIEAIDNNSEEWNKNPDNIKERTTLTAAKILQAYNDNQEGNFKQEQLPFNIEEAKLITGFVLHQKLTDLMFAIENINPMKKTDFYDKMANMNYKAYAEKYLVNEKHPDINEFSQTASLHNIKNYLSNNSNYRIYHTMDDYLTNKSQLKQLRRYSKSRLTLIDKGAHLGFLYRNEFLDDLKKEISLKPKANL